jgi:hypothetical protein
MSLLLVGAAVMLAGCPSRNPVTFTRSKFLQGLNWNALVNSCVTMKDATPQWGGQGTSGSSGGGSAAGMETVESDFHGSFFFQDAAGKRVETRPEDIDHILRSLREGLRGEATASGATLLTQEETVANGLLQGFQLAYQSGNAMGQIRGECSVAKESPGLTSLTIKLREEITPDSPGIQGR